MCLLFGVLLNLLFASTYLLLKFSFASQGVLSFLLDRIFTPTLCVVVSLAKDISFPFIFKSFYYIQNRTL